MAKHEPYFKQEFDKLAVNGSIGRPDGVPAYAYIRVSSDEQGEEGRSGLPRQIEHVHERALAAGYCISWDRVFADDFTGFELERPELDRLRSAYRSPQRRASVVVMEHLDRLSRNADWHQGFLLDEMKKRGVEPVFWKTFGSRVERMVMGVVSQDAMELSLQRMADGMLKKAESGRVTAKRPNYGYKFVDELGSEGERARKMTHYAIREDEAAVMRRVYQRVAAGDTLVQIATDLDAAGVPPPKRTKQWKGSYLNVLVKNEVYKGDFIAHRRIWIEVERPTKDGLATDRVKRIGARPESEWVHVPVPALVDAATWQAANDMLARNKAMAARNADKHQRYLLTGLLKCPDCGTTFQGRTLYPTQYNRRKTVGQNYSCRFAALEMRYIRDAHGQCTQRTIAASIIEPAVWLAVCTALLDPDGLVSALQADLFDEQNTQLEQQIVYLEREINARKDEDDKLYRAYVAGAFDETEYADRRALLKAEAARLASDRDKLLPQRVTEAQFEEQKAFVYQFAERLRALDAHLDPPFEVKQRILKMTVKQIILNTREKWFRLEGIVRGTYAIENTSVNKTIHNIPFEVLYALDEKRVISVTALPNFPLRRLDEGGQS